MELKLLTCLCAVFVIIDVNGERCHHHLRQITSTLTTSATGQAITFSLQQPAMIERININVCDQDRALADGTFNVTFVDASDFTNQERIYSENQNGKWSHAATKNVYAWITFNPALYTRKLTIKHWYAVQCSTLHVLGCSPNEMFNQTFCKNGGTAIEQDQCACPTGYIGSSCDKPVRDMTVDDFDFVVNISNIVYTKDAAFNISGEVSFTFDAQSTDTRSRRHLHHSLGHLLHGLAHFTGHGGSLHYSATNLAGFLHSNHHTYGHHPSHSIYSGLSNFLTGFSHSVQVKFGHNHHHSNYHYFYTTHGTNHLSHGASLHFHNHFLHMNVHYANSNGHHHHFHLNFKWNPLPHIKYNIVSSFHPHLGASLFINGHNVASLNRPAVTAPHNNFPGIPQPLCFGLCGAKPGSGPSNLTVGNIAVAGANVATMAKNFLLGLLGLPMLNLLTPQATTSTPLKTTVATKVSSTTSHHGGFTLAPTSTPPATATAGFCAVGLIAKNGFIHRWDG
ncbi:uncharacterized protein LOC132724483 [Ruditapes philippinarum]|uniref:uncharacterized protein LOC132724483 n=1 Tax=Ruditapes philippinarum TaxID=129788 RepID=UPI00295A706F|nr:uncharacterized protein LOC132724483 [Ruditapes philippinarum]